MDFLAAQGQPNRSKKNINWLLVREAIVRYHKKTIIQLILDNKGELSVVSAV